MKQKASIARSVVHDPPVMIFDEPTTGLDVMSSRTIVKFIRHCADQGKTVIFSTHIMSEAVRLCDRIGIIHRGRLYAEGTPDQLLQKTGSRNLEDAFVSIVGE
jgi:sodium transport system ATP-binding protein